jgi:photosystem II stability/assembly factor-like uncharacterized protein
MKFVHATLLAFVFATASSAQWIKQSVNTAASFRGLSVVSEKIVWASGTGGTVIRTIDGGKTWEVMTVPGAEKLDFRDIEAFDADTAFVLSIGNGESSRIYKTSDGGATWKLQFTNKNEKAFFDAIACWSKTFCLAMSDPVDGRFIILSTVDGGASWKIEQRFEGPTAREGEAAFAASGTCIIATPDSKAFLIVSGGSTARVSRGSRRTDGGIAWQTYDTPITKGTSGSGIFSIAMRDANNGVIVGGNYEKPDDRNDTFATTSDGGIHWKLGARPNGYRSGVAFVDRDTLVAVGTNGSDISYGRSLNWESLGTESLNSVAAKGRNAIWSVGPKGNVFRLDPKKLHGGEKNTSSYHLINVYSMTLSHSVIAGDCISTEKTCASSTTIEIATSGPDLDDAPHEYAYIVSEGTVIGDGPHVQWNLSQAKPGKYTITAGIRIPFLGGAYWDFGGTTRTEQVTVR